MTYYQNCNQVVSIYMADIEFSYQKLLRYFARKAENNLAVHINHLISTESPQKTYHRTLRNLGISISSSWSSRRFRLRLIHIRIFCGLRKKPFENINDFYDLLILINKKTINFLEEYFNFLPYTSMKEIIGQIIDEKKQDIERLKDEKSA